MPFGIDLADPQTRKVLAYILVGIVLVCLGSAFLLVILAITSSD